ncbi:MAG: choice-of-anchor M domain-containing protein [Propionibacteriaceae bacterium]|jgi:surface-anchored protein|nr:choice-of-anchor M domain-containing protein [Propionibacteriaceae bacterium]
MSIPAFATSKRCFLSALVLVGMLTGSTTAFADEGGDDPLNQTLGELAIVHGQRVLENGHIDMGPKYEDDGTWRFLIHDDVAKADANATSVWRYPAETVFQVVDAARLSVPDDPAYSFLGAAAGSEVYVVPQTQHPQVVWLGWNTQDPEVMATIQRGITLSLSAVQGPGVMTTYLQSGSFGEPQLLWDSRKSDAQPIWVDVNTHTHANWVFTQPGVYLVELIAEADLIDGSHVSDTQQIRFAVGSATAPEAAFNATWDTADNTTDSNTNDPAIEAPDTQATDESAKSTSNPLVTLLIVLIGLVALALVIGITVVVIRSNRAKQRIFASQQTVENAGLPPEGDQV